jgi:predicted DCC family thiol-disulfide oxidoreductase YuxK
VKSDVRVAVPPGKPVMIYDGDCRFCVAWIHRWQSATGERVDYLAAQDPGVAARFPEIPREQFQSSVQLIETDGTVFHGAEAVYRSLALGANRRWLRDCYYRWPAFAGFSEWSYRLVARHRTVFSFLTRLLWGRHVGRPAYVQTRWVFLRLIGIVYLSAFISLWTQITALIGRNGILPLELRMQRAHEQVASLNLGLDGFRQMPTLGWINASDTFLNLQCATGVALAILLILGIAPAPCLFLLWLIYLSLATAGDVFLGFQWDALLLETGFLAIFFAPLQWLPRRPTREAPPSRIALWLLRWLIFRLMFESGMVKLLSGDPTWHDLTALTYHYETQPLPTWIGWYAHQLPLSIQKASTLGMFAVELVVPFLIFLPRRPRQVAVIAFILLQLVILLTGNYCFFNLLTAALCVPLLDDQALQRFRPRRWKNSGAVSAEIPAPGESGPPARSRRRRFRWPLPVTVPLAIIAVSVSTVQMLVRFGIRRPAPPPLMEFCGWVAPWQTFNAYGLFAVMTTTRPEIILEGSADGVNWKAYEFKYKAGDLGRRPEFVAPHQPRLDWQMWFAALGDYRRNPWLINFCVRLLQGSPEAISLLEQNPFPDAPPRYVRAQLYEYHFTTFAQRRETGEWWRREFKGEYLPALSLRGAGPGNP